ncbi:hypothetical protein BDQ17DRAFT_1428978 [Cyathus striatus]|nr:hypothetical protein BDQ17DRAFT_1428978 [Cyathus striatus]
MLQNAKSICFGSYGQVIRWTQFSPDLKRAVVSTVLLPSIEQVEFRGVYNLPIILARTLVIHRTTYWESDRAGLRLLKDKLSPRDCKLEKFKISGCYYATEDVLAIVPNLMSEHKDTLTTIELTNVFCWEDVHLLKLDIGILPHLRTIRVFVDLFQFNTFNDATKILEKARQGNEIQEIIIEYAPQSFIGSKVIDSEPVMLDRLFTGPLFPNLRKVVFCVTREIFEEYMVKHSVEEIKAYFPMTYARGLVQMDTDHYLKVIDDIIDEGMAFE